MARGDKNFSPETPKENDWSALGRLWPFLWQFKARVIGAMSLLIAAKLANVTLPIILKYIVDTLDKTPEKVIVLPLGLLLLYGGLRFGSVLFGELRDVVFAKVTQRSMREIALKVFKHLHALDLAFHLERRTGGLSRDIERGLSGISFLQRFMLFNVIPTLIEIGLVAVILAAAYSIWYALITLGAVIFYITFSVMATEWRTRYVREANALDSKANTRSIDALLNYETVKYFNNERWEAERYDTALARWESASLNSNYSLAGLNAGQSAIIAVAVTAMMIMAANDVVNGAMTLGDLVLINAYIIQLFLPLNFLGFVYREIKRSLADMGRMFRILDKVPTISSSATAPVLKPNGGSMQFVDVAFGYHSNRGILKGVSFTVPAGSTVAVVGPSGAGKSTLARLLFRFYDPDSGSIEIDGQAIQQADVDSVRAQIGVVPQDTVLFNDTIEYNIQYGRPEATIEEVHEAARLAHLDNFIEQLPEGYDTTVGERGLKLSGGEKQRIAIARAILKDPAILVFDEATSSLDTETEQAILGAMREVAATRTTLTIAHRLSTIVDADQIIVLADGRIAETGRHTDLLAAGGLYKRLWDLQKHDSEHEQVQDPTTPTA